MIEGEALTMGLPLVHASMPLLTELALLEEGFFYLHGAPNGAAATPAPFSTESSHKP
jgi:hypothetical protein